MNKFFVHIGMLSALLSASSCYSMSDTKTAEKLPLQSLLEAILSKGIRGGAVKPEYPKSLSEIQPLIEAAKAAHQLKGEKYIQNFWFIKPPLFAAIRADRPELIRAIVEAGADVNTPLNIPHYEGHRPLNEAAVYGNIAAIKELLKLGAQVNAQHPVYGTTALYAAAHNNHVDAVKELLSAGADASIKDKSGKTVLEDLLFVNRIESSKEEQRRYNEILDLLAAAHKYTGYEQARARQAQHERLYGWFDL